MGFAIVLLVAVLLVAALMMGFVKEPGNVRTILYCIFIGLIIFLFITTL